VESGRNNKTMSMSNYKLFEDLKQSLIATLLEQGLVEQVKTINDDDLLNIAMVMIKTEKMIKLLPNNDFKTNYLQEFILKLLTIMQVDYGIDLKELKI
jgi:hypothetical protein